MGILADRITAKRRVRASDAVVELPEVCCAAPESSEPVPRDAVLDPSDDRVRLWNRFAMMAEKDERLATLYMWLREAFCSQRWQDSPFRVLHVDMLKTEGDTLYVRFNIYSETRVYHIQAHLRPKDAYDDYLGATYTTRKDDPGEDWNRGADLSDGEFSRETFNKIVGDFLSLEILPHLDPDVYPAGASNAPSFYHELYIDEGKKGIVPIVEKSKNGIVEVLAKKKIEELKHGLTRDGKRYGVSIGKDKDGYFCYTHRARSKSYPTIADIPKSALKFIDSTGMRKIEGKAEVYLGESGLDKSWQAEFPADAKCCRCGGDARIAFVMQETPESDGPSIADIHERNREGNGGLWLHDAGSFAVYLCEKCLEPTTLYNQAMKADAKKDTVASALEFLMSMPLYERDRNEGATVAEEIASSKHGLGPESHRIYDALCLLFVDKNAGLMFGDMPISDALDKLKEMGHDGVTRRKTEGHEPVTASAKGKELNIWDFDGTLIDTGEFHQNRIDNPKPIKKNLERFKRQIADDEDVVVMTARGNAGLVRKTLEDAGVDMTGIRIIALGTTKNEAKGEYIAKNFASKYDTITLYDDRKAYLEAAEEAMEEKDVTFKTVKAAASSDAEYLAAVERNDMATAQRMVDQAAKAAGYNIGPVYHGTDREFNEFKNSGIVWFSSDKQDAADYSPSRIVSVFLTIDEAANLDDDDVQEILGKAGIDAQDLYTLTKRGRRVRTLLSMKGYDGIVVERLDVEQGVLHYGVFMPEQIKSADPITKDDSGNIIPLSKRFNSSSNDIRARRIMSVTAGEMDRQHHYEVEARGFDTRGSLDAAFRGIQVYNGGMSREVVVAPENGKPIKIDFDGDGFMKFWCDTADYEDGSTSIVHVYCNDAAQKSVEELLKALSKHNRLQLTIPDTDWTEIGDTGTFNGDEPVVTGWEEVEMTDIDRKKVEAAIVKKYQITYADGTCAFRDMTPNHAESMRGRDGVAAVALMDLPDEKVEAGNKNKGEYDLWGSIEKAVERGLLAYVGFMAADYLHQKKNASFGLENYRPVIDAYGEIGHSDKLTDEDKSVILKRLNDAGWDASDEGIEFLWDEILRHRQIAS